MRMVMIIFALLLLIGGGALSVMKWLEIGPFAPEDTMAEKVVPVLPPRFLDMDPIIVPLIQDGGVAATVQISLKLETRGDENATAIKRAMPKLKNAFIQDMYTFLPRLLKDQERLDAYVLKKRFQLIADQVFQPPGTVSDVLIQSVTDQPGN